MSRIVVIYHKEKCVRLETDETSKGELEKRLLERPHKETLKSHQKNTKSFLKGVLKGCLKILRLQGFNYKKDQ